MKRKLTHYIQHMCTLCVSVCACMCVNIQPVLDMPVCAHMCSYYHVHQTSHCVSVYVCVCERERRRGRQRERERECECMCVSEPYGYECVCLFVLSVWVCAWAAGLP